MEKFQKMIELTIENSNMCSLRGDRATMVSIYEKFKVKHPSAFYIMKKGNSRWDGYIKYISEAGRFRIGLLPKIYNTLKEEGVKVNIVDRRPPLNISPVIKEKLGDKILYPRQKEALKRLLFNKVGDVPFLIEAADLAVGFGKCIHGSSLINTNYGIHRIDEVVNEKGEFREGLKVLAQDGEYHSVNGATFDNMKAIKITTCKGYTQICGYDRHRYYTIDEKGQLNWVLARELKVGDYLPIKFGKPVSGKSSITPDQAYLVGIIQGDGKVSLKSPTRVHIAVSGEDYEILDKILPIWNQLCKRPAKAIQHRKFNGWHISHSDKHFSKWFIQNFPELLGNSHQKKVPKVVLDSSLEVQYAYMAGLIDTDGSRHSTNIEYSFSSVCEENIHRIQYMLLNWGIVSFVSVKKTSWTNQGVKKKSISYRLRVPALEAIKFGNLLPIQVPRKKVPQEWSNRENLFYQLPEPIGRIVRESYLQRGYSNRNNPFTSHKHAFGRTLLTQILKPNRITRESLKLFLEVVPNSYLNSFLEFSKGVYWDKIKSIEIVESAPCYDISVPDIHSYVADGFICHNTMLFSALHEAFGRKLKTILLLNDSDLFNQFKSEIPPLMPGEDIKFIQGGKATWGNFNVAMVQSVSQNLKKYSNNLSQIDMVLIDEADIIDNRTYKTVIEHLWSSRIRIGLSGTLYMSKLKKDLVHNLNVMSFIGEKVDQVKLIDQMRADKATPVVVKMIETGYNLDYAANPIKSYPEEYTDIITQNEKAYQVSLDRALYNLKYGRLPMLIVTKYIEHCEELYKFYEKRLRGLGLNLKIAHVHHETKSRKDILDRFRKGGIDILIATTIISRGKNFPTLKYLQNTASMDSNERAIQILGRLVRQHASKDKAYLDDLMFNGRYLSRHAKHRNRYYKEQSLKVIKVKLKSKRVKR